MSESDPDTHPEAAVAPGYLMNHGARVFDRIVDEALRPHGVSLALIGPILLLDWLGPMTQRAVVSHSAVKQPAIAALTAKLESMELIVRDPTPGDRRSALLRLTPRGREIAQRSGEILRDINAVALKDFTEEERLTLVRLTQRLIANMESHKA